MEIQAHLLTLAIAGIPVLAMFYLLRPPKGTQDKLHLRKILAGFFAASYMLLACFLWYTSISHPPHYRLTVDAKNDHIYRQLRQPTSDEIDAGRRALKLWKTFTMQERNKMADDLVLSRVLIGLTQREIVSQMGLPDAFGTLHDVSPTIEETGYNAADSESQCDLIIELKNGGKASDVYLIIDY